MIAMFGRVALITAVLLGLLVGALMVFPAGAWDQTTPAQHGALFNSQTTAVAGTASITIAAAANTQGHIYSLAAFCSAGTATLSLTDGGTTTWSTNTGFVGTAIVGVSWTPVPYTGAINSALIVALSTCGGGNTGTLSLQGDRY